ncbi:MAG TPA: PQQ-binding-like beta-propeller repeat protein [Gemmatales bacterium]|nr:PQQ-binding-like beta-propeller repeat protein [Gemmatales bacterium]
MVVQRLAVLALIALASACAVPAVNDHEKLFAALRAGDVAAVRQLLDDGVDVNSKNEFGLTALAYAASAGQVDLVKLLIERKANVNQADSYYGMSPLVWAAFQNHPAVAKELLAAGASGEVMALNLAIQRNRLELVQVILDSGRVKQEALDTIYATTPVSQTQLRELLKKAGAKEKPAEPSPTAPKATEPAAATPTAAAPPTPTKPAEPVVPSIPVEPDGLVETARPWSSFRGPGATGVADGQWPPTGWDGTTGRHLLWKSPIPGLGLSCPIVWGDRVFITTAINEKQARPSLRVGQYGDVDSLKEDDPHVWKVMCLAADSGRLLWERTAHTGVPKTKRHTKSSHANCTPATDGRFLVVHFGSEGLYCYSVEGELLWQKDLGTLAASWFFHPDYEWGYGSSPIIFRDLVIIQCDVGKDSYIAAYRLQDGSEAWRTARDELPGWGTPTVVEPEGGEPELVTLGTRAARGYDPLTGAELWRLGKFSDITVPTPFLARGLIFVTSGYRPIQPIYAVRPGQRGDLSLKDKEEGNEAIAWSKQRGGPYLPTPIAYGEHLYVCSNAGVLTCYALETGQQVYQKRIGGVNGYTASPVAADGRLYFTGEDGVVRVVRAGPEYELLAQNPLGEDCLATPAISNGVIYIRGVEHLFAFRRPPTGN